MNVLLINGSPRAKGNTAFALNQMAQVFAEQGIETEIIQVGHLPIRGCTACKGCYTTGKCVIDDIVNETAGKLAKTDGIVLGTPVYYASANGTLIAFLDRLFYSNHADLRLKVGAGIVVARRGGCSAAFDQLNKYLTISGMTVASSHYWNSIHGSAPGEASQDPEGIAVMRNLAKNMSFLIKSIDLGRKTLGVPEYDPRTSTNFIR